MPVLLHDCNLVALIIRIELLRQLADGFVPQAEVGFIIVKCSLLLGTPESVAGGNDGYDTSFVLFEDVEVVNILVNLLLVEVISLPPDPI